MNEIRYKAVAKEFWTNWCEKNPVVSKYFDDTLEDFAKNGREFFEIPLIEEMKDLHLTNEDMELYFKYMHKLEVKSMVRLKKEEDMGVWEYLKGLFTFNHPLDGFLIDVKVKY